jgi:hypothetical protein
MKNSETVMRPREACSPQLANCASLTRQSLKAPLGKTPPPVNNRASNGDLDRPMGMGGNHDI